MGDLPNKAETGAFQGRALSGSLPWGFHNCFSEGPGRHDFILPFICCLLHVG